MRSIKYPTHENTRVYTRKVNVCIYPMQLDYLLIDSALNCGMHNLGMFTFTGYSHMLPEVKAETLSRWSIYYKEDAHNVSTYLPLNKRVID